MCSPSQATPREVHSSLFWHVVSAPKFRMCVQYILENLRAQPFDNLCWCSGCCWGSWSSFLPKLRKTVSLPCSAPELIYGRGIPLLRNEDSNCLLPLNWNELVLPHNPHELPQGLCHLWAILVRFVWKPIWTWCWSWSGLFRTSLISHSLGWEVSNGDLGGTGRGT